MRLFKLLLPLAAGLTAAGALSAQPASQPPRSPRAVAWWEMVTTLSADDMHRREAASEGHAPASALLAERYRALGLEPAGENGSYFQAVRLEETRFAREGIEVGLVRDGRRTALSAPGRHVF